MARPSLDGGVAHVWSRAVPASYLPARCCLRCRLMALLAEPGGQQVCAMLHTCPRQLSCSCEGLTSLPNVQNDALRDIYPELQPTLPAIGTSTCKLVRGR